MRIDWNHGQWRLWNEEGAMLDSAASIICRSPVEFVNADRDHKGYAVTIGTVRRMGDVLVIENERGVSHG